MKRNNGSKSITGVVADLDNAGAIEAQKALVKALPEPMFSREIPTARTYTDDSLNPRDNEIAYGKEHNPDLATSIDTYGIDESKELMVFSAKADGRFLTLRGNVRTSVIRDLNRESKEQTGTERFPTLVGLVYHGLTREQEILIVADHTGRRDLNTYEMALMVGRTSDSRGWTDKVGSAYFGLNPNMVRRLRMRYAMPPVLDDARKEARSLPDALKITNSENEALHSAYLLDQRDNNPPRFCGGRNFKIGWQAMLDARERRASGVTDKKPKTAKDIEQVLTSYASDESEGLAPVRDMLRWVSGDPAVRVYDTIDNVKKLIDGSAAEVERLTRENELLASENASLRLSLRKSAELVASLRADNASLRDMVGSPTVQSVPSPSAGFSRDYVNAMRATDDTHDSETWETSETVETSETAGPAGPVETVEPAGPVETSETAGPVETSETAGTVEPVGTVEPAGPVETAGPVAPAGPVEPAGKVKRSPKKSV